MSKVKTSLPLKLGAGLICGATLIACVGALTVPARAAESKCGDDNKLSECVTDEHLRTPLKTNLNTFGSGAGVTDDTLVKTVKERPITVAVTGEENLDLAGLGTFKNAKSCLLYTSDAADE